MSTRAPHRLKPALSLALGIVLIVNGVLHAFLDVFYPWPVRVLAVVIFLLLGLLFVRRFVVERRRSGR